MDVIDQTIVDRNELAFKRYFAGTGAVPKMELWRMEWSELLETRNALNRGINDKLQEAEEGGNTFPTEEAGQAIHYASDVLDSVQSEINLRDQSGNRGPRKSGRQSVDEVPGRHSFQPASSPKPSGKSGSYQALFGSPGNDGTQFTDLGDFARAVYAHDPRLFQNASGMSGGVGPDGGFFVPTGFLAGIMDASLQDEAIRSRAWVVPMPAPSMTLPVFDTTNRASGIAGMEPEHSGEGHAGTPQKGTTKSVNLFAHKLMVLVPTTSELMEDGGPTFTQLLQRYMQESLSQRLDDLFINGTGNGMPLGIINAPCTVSVAKDSAQIAATVTPTNLAGMISRLAPGAFNRSVWLAHPSVLSSLFVLAQVVKNVAGTENVGGFGPNWFSVLADGSYSLLGRPLIVSDRCHPLGTVGDIILADLSQYIVGIRGEARLAVDTSYGFNKDEVYFRLTMRIDGEPLLGNAITPRKGSATLSPFVTVATRS